MDRREMFGMMGATAGILALGAAKSAKAADDKSATHIHEHDKMHMSCLEACGHCAAVCNESASHCLSMLASGTGDLKYHARAHAIASDCSTFCAHSAMMISSKSELMMDSCKACEAACKACAEVCEKSDAEEMKECAKACRDCEKTCSEMVKRMKSN